MNDKKDQATYVEVTNAETQTTYEDFVKSVKGGMDSSESEDLDDDKIHHITHHERFKKSLRLTKEQVVSNTLIFMSVFGIRIYL